MIILQHWNKMYKHFNLWSIKRWLQKVTSCLRGILSDSCHYVCWLIAHTNIYSPLSGILECARHKTLYFSDQIVSWFHKMFVTGFHDTDSRCHVTRVIYNLHWGIGHCRHSPKQGGLHLSDLFQHWIICMLQAINPEMVCTADIYHFCFKDFAKL